MVSPEVGAQRTKQRPENETIETVEEIAKLNEGRVKLELDRYRVLYGIENFLDPEHYDFTLDTTDLTEAEVLEAVLKQIRP